jgi:hypothetical protein
VPNLFEIAPQVEAGHNGGGESRPVAVLGFEEGDGEVPEIVVANIVAEDI